MSLLRSFTYAFRGLCQASSQRNLKIHASIAILVIMMGIGFSVTMTEWALLFVCIGLVFSAEIFNSALEEISNILRDDHHHYYEKLGKPKDMAAAAVLVTAFFALLVGILIFVPHVLLTLNQIWFPTV